MDPNKHTRLCYDLCICDPMSRCDQWWLVLAIHHLRLVCAREREEERAGQVQATSPLSHGAHTSTQLFLGIGELNTAQ